MFDVLLSLCTYHFMPCSLPKLSCMRNIANFDPPSAPFVNARIALHALQSYALATARSVKPSLSLVSQGQSVRGLSRPLHNPSTSRVKEVSVSAVFLASVGKKR